MKHVMCAFVAVAAFSAAALGQFAGGVNIDLNSTTGAGAGQPTILYGGAAAQTGYWNPVNGPFTVGGIRTIRNLANSADAVTLRIESASLTGSLGFDNAQSTGDAALLLEDIHNLGNVGGTGNYSVGPFAGGVYDVYTYAIAPDSSAGRMVVSVYTSSTDPSEEVTVGGAMPAGGATVAGVTHSVHRLAVARGERIYINARGTAGAASVNGFQIKPVTGVTRLYVDDTSTNLNRGGTTWATSLTSLQTAVSVANDTPSVTEIWVAIGQYRPDEVIYTTDDRSAAFRPRGGLSIYGGFNGTEATLAARTLHPVVGTFITGTLGLTGSTADDSYHLMYAPSTGGTLTLDGLKFQATTPLDAGGVDRAGSALDVDGGTVVIRDCHFRFCTGNGAAVAVRGGASVTIDRTLFHTNKSNATTALDVDEAGTQVTVDRCVFRNNTMYVGYLGSLISSAFGASLTMTNTLVHDNRLTGVGGMFMFTVAQATARLDNCTFANNNGGGMYLTAGFPGEPVSFACHNSILWGNRRTYNPEWPIEQHQIHPLGSIPNTTFTDCIIEGYEGTRFAGLANLNADPLFIDPNGADDTPGSMDDNYRLGSRSPGRDSAWYNGLLASARTLDLDDAPRVFDDAFVSNTGFASGTNPLDRGCYEAQVTSDPCPGDIGRAGGLPGADGLRDNNDFIAFINFFFALDPRGDLGVSGGFPGSDGLFDNNDFIAFIDLFFSEC